MTTIRLTEILQGSAPTGYTGSLGYTGSYGTFAGMGYTGSLGYTGSQSTEIGYTGSQGDTGNIGYSGSRGYTGSQSYTGSQGYTGSMGYTGSTGAAVALSTNNTDTATYYIPMSTATSGNWTSGVMSDGKMYFVPNTGTLNATIFNTLSDENAKINIEQISNALDIIKQINGVGFNWKDNGLKSYGVIAQLIEQLVPALVETNDKGIKSVNYQGLIAFLIEAVKELSNRVEALEKDKV